MEGVETKKKVLVVDDEPNVRSLSRRILSQSFNVIEAEDGRQAIEIASTQNPDIILMDIMMPKMDGITACHKIKNNPLLKSIPVIMVTAIGFELNIKLSLRIGAQGYVTKPFVPTDLIDNIRRVLQDV